MKVAEQAEQIARTLGPARSQPKAFISKRLEHHECVHITVDRMIEGER
jgi:hypothetical protein